MDKRIKALIVLLIASLAILWRFYQLPSNPPGLYVDEAAIGYNAFSILKTGRDEYGKAFPVYFRSFADYKMPLYIYLTVIPTKLFGLSPFSVRLVSAVSGLAIVVLVYLLADLLWSKRSFGFKALVSLIVAICPWAVFISRAAFETSLALALLLLALYLQIYGLKKRPVITLVSALFYALAAYSYHSQRLLAPLIFLIVFGFFGLKQKRAFAYSGFALAVLLLPQWWLLSSGASQARVRALVNLKSLRNTASLYSTYFSPRSLFFEPDPDPQRSLPGLSVFYDWLVGPYLLGLYVLLRRQSQKETRLILVLGLISPLPAALTGDPFATVRAYPLVFPLGIVLAEGIWFAAEKLKSGRVRALLATFLLVYSLACLYRSVFVYLPNYRFKAWSYGFKLLAQEIARSNYPKVLIEDALGISYIEMLFFTSFPPATFQKSVSSRVKGDYYNAGAWSGVYRWAGYEVRAINWEKDIYEPQLIVATPLSISPGQAKEHFLTSAFAIMGPDNQVLYHGYLTNPQEKKLDDERKQARKQ